MSHRHQRAHTHTPFPANIRYQAHYTADGNLALAHIRTEVKENKNKDRKKEKHKPEVNTHKVIANGKANESATQSNGYKNTMNRSDSKMREHEQTLHEHTLLWVFMRGWSPPVLVPCTNADFYFVGCRLFFSLCSIHFLEKEEKTKINTAEWHSHTSTRFRRYIHYWYTYVYYAVCNFIILDFVCLPLIQLNACNLYIFNLLINL